MGFEYVSRRFGRFQGKSWHFRGFRRIYEKFTVVPRVLQRSLEAFLKVKVVKRFQRGFGENSEDFRGFRGLKIRFRGTSVGSEKYQKLQESLREV